MFPKFLEHGERFVGYQEDFYWSDIGTLAAYRQAQYDVLSGKVGVKIPGEKRGEGLWVGEDAQIHSSAEIEGHVLIGKDAVVGRDVKLLGDVTVGSDCWIRPNVTIKRSILLPGASVGGGAYLEDCIVGHHYDVRPQETIRGGALISRLIRRAYGNMVLRNPTNLWQLGRYLPAGSRSRVRSLSAWDLSGRRRACCGGAGRRR